MEITGFDELQRKLEQLARAADKLHGTHEVKLDDILHPLFMLENTSFGSIDEFFQASPFVVKTQEDLNALDPMALDAFVREKTRFQSWHEMKDFAVQEWMKKRFDAEMA